MRSFDELRSYFANAGKPAAQWRVGTEHELIGVIRETGEAPPYDGPHGIGALLDAFAKNAGEAVLEHGHAIAIARGDAQITIEPGGQYELAGPPVSDDREFAADLAAHVKELAATSQPLGLAWLAIGFRPFGVRSDVPWMPKERYDVMRAYMPTVGSRGLEMMQRTATVQANLDFADEADAAAKMKCLYSVTSLLTALYAASPIVDEKISGYQTYRAWIWRDTDNQRAGLVPFVFEREDIFTAYTEWALDVPMYFVYRNGYVRVPADLTFRKFMSEGWNGEHATRADWALHLSTLFPEGRLKKFIEVRGCDCGSMPMNAALAPFTRGFLYDQTARDAATKLVDLAYADRLKLADEIPRMGFAARIGSHTVGELAKELVAIAHDGLSRVAPAAASLLAPLDEIVATGRTQSDRIIELWQNHAGDRPALIAALAHPGLA
ncbi:MAG TPA: glutamate-cysteine ligase family protein [Kofleriaceae bacterium]